jgi:hypothetical protein
MAMVAMMLVTSMGMSTQVPSRESSNTLSDNIGQEMDAISDSKEGCSQNPDTDGDDLWDVDEAKVGTDPTNPDTDGDGLWDGRECRIGTDPSSRDTDGDGLWDGQEVKKNDYYDFHTGTDPLRRDTDGDGVGDYEDDEDNDFLPNGEEWRYDESTGRPMMWTRARNPDTDGDGVLDGHEEYGNPNNLGQTSDPRMRDTDRDRLTDDIDPSTWIRNVLPLSRIRGNSDTGGPVYPTTITKGVPFTVEGWVEINCTHFFGGDTGNWRGAFEPVKVQVSLIQDGLMIPISDEIVTGDRGAFKVSCTIGDDVTAGEAILAITTSHHQKVIYWPALWDETFGNHFP